MSASHTAPPGQALNAPLIATTLPLQLLTRGKVRDVYEVDAERILLIATDRVSAFDVVLGESVPFKGAVLTQLTAWWLRQIDFVPNHMITADASEIVHMLPELASHRAQLEGRAMLARRARVFPVECVVRAYLAGSAWKEYRNTGHLAGEAITQGLVESAPLDRPRFTPATKAEAGHDENISRARARAVLGPVADDLEQLSLKLFALGSDVAATAGLILADTKFEFGERAGEVILIDEVMTPDSSRFWARDTYRAGSTPPSFDKQPLRDYLQSLRDRAEWNGEAPAPAVPESVVAEMTERYLEAFRRITGSPLDIGACA
ncbi:MAG: phosphoribosylaminoimidazolesuccinocarboxamide synthase [Gemmatimonadota bacterium]|nr:phosphoribosylaminoimidazolesuccinocarboxamide synthase [Gemmatimonadota bacterium]